MPVFRICLLMAMSFAYSSCRISTAISLAYKIRNKKIEKNIWTNGDKTVVFIPMIHIGKAEFYNDVKRNIDSLKQAGYAVMYEGIKMSSFDDSVKNATYNWVRKTTSVKTFYHDSADAEYVTNDIYKRKFRRFIGFNPDSGGYAHQLTKIPFANKIVSQPKLPQLGIDSNDIRADVSKNILVDVYEQTFGKINLDEIDFTRSLAADTDYPASSVLPKKKTRYIILNYRDTYLAGCIYLSKAKNIAVIYGGAHAKGTFKELKKKDNRWRTLN